MPLRIKVTAAELAGMRERRRKAFEHFFGQAPTKAKHTKPKPAKAKAKASTRSSTTKRATSKRGGKLTGAAKKAFLARMAKGRAAAARKSKARGKGKTK